MSLCVVVGPPGVCGPAGKPGPDCKDPFPGPPGDCGYPGSDGEPGQTFTFRFDKLQQKNQTEWVTSDLGLVF